MTIRGSCCQNQGTSVAQSTRWLPLILNRKSHKKTGAQGWARSSLPGLFLDHFLTAVTMFILNVEGQCCIDSDKFMERQQFRLLGKLSHWVEHVHSMLGFCHRICKANLESFCFFAYLHWQIWQGCKFEGISRDHSSCVVLYPWHIIIDVFSRYIIYLLERRVAERDGVTEWSLLTGSLSCYS